MPLLPSPRHRGSAGTLVNGCTPQLSAAAFPDRKDNSAMFGNIRKIAKYLPTLIRVMTNGCEAIERIADELQEVRKEFRELVSELDDVKEEVLRLRDILPEPPDS